ncbi:F0F1 ATP synthase subunit epsilon [Microvirga antarctica]|uniref:F0F1 ATP synthase subunit epsilon n=1 Tax=Microvirga antarctica TaxID=2819233 RepID=UPI001B306081|nr:F0F1 ATP synthase subunit epsilon [Microvirga antarctica]
MANFNFELVSPESVLFSGMVDAVILPATEGEMTVLAGHAPTMTTLKTGFLVITDSPGNGKRILIRGGFADINPTGLTVLAERALPAEELTQEILDKEILHAQMVYDATNDPVAKHAAESAVVQLEDAKVALSY